MLSNKQISKTDKSRKILHESLENYDRLDIVDSLNYEIEIINNLIANIQEFETDEVTSHYVFDLVDLNILLYFLLYIAYFLLGGLIFDIGK